MLKDRLSFPAPVWWLAVLGVYWLQALKRNTKWIVVNNTCHLFTFPVAVILASNDRSIDDKSSLLLAFLNKMYLAMTWTEGKINVSSLCMAAELLPFFAVFLSINKLSYYYQEPMSHHHIDERILPARMGWG